MLLKLNGSWLASYVLLWQSWSGICCMLLKNTNLPWPSFSNHLFLFFILFYFIFLDTVHVWIYIIVLKNIFRWRILYFFCPILSMILMLSDEVRWIYLCVFGLGNLFWRKYHVFVSWVYLLSNVSSARAIFERCKMVHQPRVVFKGIFGQRKG